MQAVIVLILRAWVTREGGLPDSGRNTRNIRVARRQSNASAAAAAAALNGASRGGCRDGTVSQAV